MKTIIILTALSAMAAGLGPGTASAGGAATKSIRLGVCDWTIDKSGDPAALEMAGRLGLEGVQVSLTVKDGSLAMLQPALQKAYRDEAKRTGVAVASFCVGDLNGVPLKSDPRAEAWLRQAIAAAKTMGVGIVLVPFFGNSDLKNDGAGIEAVVRALKRLAPEAEAVGVVLALENQLSAEENSKILDRVGSPSVRIYYDVANSQGAGYDVAQEIRWLGRRIVECHAKDTKGLYGKGSIDFEAVRQALDDVRYDGWLVLEGTEMPLGLEKSIRYDVDYLRTLFPRKSPAVPIASR